MERTPHIFIGGECSGVVRSAIRALRPGAWVLSVDHKPAEDGEGAPTTYSNGGHWIGDMCDVVDMFAEDGRYFDAGVWHPVCTYLTNSAAWAYTDGPYHQQVKPETLVGAARRAARAEQLEYIARIWRLPVGRKLLENPAQGALTGLLGRPSQIVQPYMFGDDASKATGFWNQHAAPLAIPPAIEWVQPRVVAGLPRWANQTDSGQNRVSPGAGRTTERSRTYPGIGRALAVALLASADETIRRNTRTEI